VQAAKESCNADEVSAVLVLVVQPWWFVRCFAVNEGEDLAAKLVELAEAWRRVEPDSLEMNQERLNKLCARRAWPVDVLTDAYDPADVGAAAAQDLCVVHTASLA